MITITMNVAYAAIIVAVLLVCFAVMFAQILWGNSREGRVLSKKANPEHLPDHDLQEKRETATSTAWEHTTNCPKCLEEVDHQEIMTGICLKCGVKSTWMLNGAKRKIVLGGKWVEHLHIRHFHISESEYLREGNRWVKFNPEMTIDRMKTALDEEGKRREAEKQRIKEEESLVTLQKIRDDLREGVTKQNNNEDIT